MLLMETLRCSDRERFTYRYGYFLPWKDALEESLRALGAEVTCFAARNNLSILMAADRVARHLRRWDADLLHCHLPIAGVVGRLAGRFANVPVVYTEHNKMERYHPLTRRLNLVTWKLQHRVVAVSGEVATSVRAHTRPGVPVDVVLNGVDVGRFDRRLTDGTAIRQELGIPPSAPIVGSVAVFRTQKRLHDWLEAARILRNLREDVHFVLVGDGPLRADLAAHAQALGLEDAVHWPGLRTDVRPFLAAMDVYMMSSIFEGLPIALLEAMAMRCAVVSTGVGGIPEVISDGNNGCLVEPAQPALLAEAAGWLLASPETMERMGASARSTVEERFSVQRMTRELEATYVEVVGSYRHAR
jgi:L-malate glycosyltransferase